MEVLGAVDCGSRDLERKQHIIYERRRLYVRGKSVANVRAKCHL